MKTYLIPKNVSKSPALVTGPFNRPKKLMSYPIPNLFGFKQSYFSPFRVLPPTTIRRMSDPLTTYFTKTSVNSLFMNLEDLREL